MTEKIRELVSNNNKNSIPTSTNVIKANLEDSGYYFSNSTLLRCLHSIRLSYGKGKRRNILHENAPDVAFRSVVYTYNILFYFIIFYKPCLFRLNTNFYYHT